MTTQSATVDDLLGRRADGSFELGRHLHGAFGGAFGGAVAATALRVAREAAAGRTPASLDVRFLRGLPAGSAHTDVTVLHAGRSLTTVSVEITDKDRRRSAVATIGLTDPVALHQLETPSAGEPPPPVDDGTRWRAPDGVEIPILSTLHPRVVGSGPSWVATGLEVPWEPDASAGAEAACLAADMCVGPPVAAACAGRWIPHPNPDLSLRFVGEVAGIDVIGLGRLERISGGLAAVGITVWAEREIVAVGACSSMLLAAAPAR